MTNGQTSGGRLHGRPDVLQTLFVAPPSWMTPSKMAAPEMTSTKTWGGLFDPYCGGGGKWRPFRFRSPSWMTSFPERGHQRWWPEAEGPPFSAAIGIEKDWIGLDLFNDDTRPSGHISRPTQVNVSQNCFHSLNNYSSPIILSSLGASWS